MLQLHARLQSHEPAQTPPSFTCHVAIPSPNDSSRGYTGHGFYNLFSLYPILLNDEAWAILSQRYGQNDPGPNKEEQLPNIHAPKSIY